MNVFLRSFRSLLFVGLFVATPFVQAQNNIEFLDKALIKSLNHGIYEVVTPKLESDQIKYSRELPFDKLDYVDRNEKYFSIGTAFFINDKELMTASHVFSLMYFSLLQDFYIRDGDGKVYPVNMIKKYSTIRDMVVFDLEKYPEKVGPLQLDGKVEIGDTVFSVGNAQGEGIAYRAGQVASFTPEREYGKWKDIRFTSPASPGNSGGPLLDLKGTVVGVIVKKNRSENYNIAVPIDEMKNLGQQAEFHLRNVVAGIYGVDDTVSKDWSFSAPLPAKVGDLARLAQDDLDNSWTSLADELMEKVKEKNYPYGERFRDYLRDQNFNKGIALLVPGKDFKKWSVDGWYGEKTAITADQNVYKSRGLGSDLHVIIEKPKGMSLKEFLDSPETVMDNFLKAVPFHRRLAKEKIPITSFGKAAQKKVVTDKLGRKWITTLWDLPYTDMFVHSSCLPYPKGVVCHVANRRNANRKYGYFDALYDGFNEMTIGYVGAVADWQEYFSLDKKYLPAIFKDAKLSYKDDHLKLRLKDFSLDFTNKKITPKSSIHLHMGYANEKLLAEDILLFELYPVKGGKAHYRIQPFFEPGLFSSDKYKSRWDDIINVSGDFSGKVVNKGDKLLIRKGVESTKTVFTSVDNKKITKIFATGCYYRGSDENVEEDCAAFASAIDFK